MVTIQRGTTYRSALLGQPGPILLGLGTIQRNGGFRDDSLKTYGGDSPGSILVQPGQLYASLKDVTQKGDLLGAVARMPMHCHPGRLTQDTVRLDVIAGDIPVEYLYWVLRTPKFREHCRAHMTGTTNLGLRREDFLAFEFPEPTAELMNLAFLIGALDSKIESNRRIAEATTDLVNSLAKRLLDAGPNDERELFALASFNLSTVKPQIGKLLDYIDIASVSQGRVETLQTIDWAKAPSRARRGVRDGDVIYSTVRPGRRSYALILEPSPSTVASTGFAVMTPKPGIGSSFLQVVAGSIAFANYLESVAHGSAYPTVSVEAMGKYLVQVPGNPSAMAHFEAVTLPMRRRVAQGERESARLGRLRDTLLPELLSGRIRVQPDVALE